jgi:hypothetical protein
MVDNSFYKGKKYGETLSSSRTLHVVVVGAGAASMVLVDKFRINRNR